MLKAVLYYVLLIIIIIIIHYFYVVKYLVFLKHERKKSVQLKYLNLFPIQINLFQEFSRNKNVIVKLLMVILVN